MARPLFVAVGVHKAATMPVLPGVLPSVTTLSDWATRQGYDVIRVDDQEAPVTVERIRAELTPFDPGTHASDPRRLLDRPRIIVYFCGHGIHVPQDQWWILSAGPNQPEQRISAVTFRDMLASYGPKQIAIISDACRTAQYVQGLGRSVVDLHEGLAVGVQKDNFFSSQDGAASFSMPPKDGNPAYCIFSSVLVRALSEPADPEALDAQYQEKGHKVVTSQSLADYLEQKVPDAALAVGKLQAPQCDSGFRPVINDYVKFGPVADIASAAESSATNARIESARATQQNDRIARSRSEWRGRYVGDIQNFAGGDIQHCFSTYGRGPLLLSSNVPSQGVAARSDAQIIERRSLTDETIRLVEEAYGPFRRHHSLRLVEMPFADTGISGVAVVNAADVFAAIPLYRKLWCQVIIDNERGGPDARQGGVELLSWSGEYSIPPPPFTAADALKGLSARTLNAEDTAVLAENMRYQKHADPLYGIVASYMYNSIGDVANIRRMCYYYKWHEQDVPFDIAMLAQLPLRQRNGGFYVEVPEVAELPAAERRRGAPSFGWEKTPAETVNVAGVTPLLRFGWQYIEASRHAVHQKCWELTGDLTDSPISTFRGAATGARLTAILREL